MTLNHAGGVLGHVLYKEMSEEIPRVGPGDGRGLPEHLRADFEKLDGDSASTQIARARIAPMLLRSEEHTSELQSLMRISYAVFCLKKTKNNCTDTLCQQSTHII